LNYFFGNSTISLEIKLIGDEMNNEKIGKTIAEQRKSKQLTQRELADKLMVSDKTVSKWETGSGCPDISIVKALSNVLDIDIESLLEGKVEKITKPMSRARIYHCKECNNVMTSSKSIKIACCGKTLQPLRINAPDGQHKYTINKSEGESYITFDHKMTKEHYIVFIAYVMYDSISVVKLYPEQDASVYLDNHWNAQMYFCCSQDGLYHISKI
jgi:transcriptional regulator with XRE-family HTH domain